jgi:hypothetical protein
VRHQSTLQTLSLWSITSLYHNRRQNRRCGIIDNMSNRKKALKKPKITVVDENPGWGVYVWRCKSDGKIFRDDDDNVLNIPSRQYDLEKIKIITEAAAYWGEPEGEPVFVPGVQRATEESFNEQRERMKVGLLPTMNDFGAVRDAKAAGRARGEKVGE